MVIFLAPSVRESHNCFVSNPLHGLIIHYRSKRHSASSVAEIRNCFVSNAIHCQFVSVPKDIYRRHLLVKEQLLSFQDIYIVTVIWWRLVFQLGLKLRHLSVKSAIAS